MKLCAVVVFYRMVVYLGNFKYFCFKNRTNLDSMNNEVKVVLFENLLPLSYTRPVADFRVGIMTIREKWEHYLPGNYSYKTTEYLGEKFPVAVSADEEVVFVAGNVLPDEDLAARVLALESGGALRDCSGLVAFRGSLRQFGELDPVESSVEGDEVSRIQYVYDVFRENGQEICRDYDLLAKRGKGQAPDASVTIIGSVESSGVVPRIYIEDGAVVEGAVLNVKNGPIYIGKDAVVMEGACLRGPVALCDNAVVRMGAKVYGSTTIGPYCKVGGELDNAVMFGFSNNAHDGYLGNAVIGEWCNLGAGANASNLKNDYTKIRIWNYHTQRFMRTDLQFCGLIMGDHSKAGINTMFNTATVVGVGVNLHGAGFPRTFIPSFSSGSPEGGFDNVSIDKFMDTAGMVMQRRGLALTDVDRRIFDTIYRSAARFK